ncbi:unnamed protein product, partial [Mesorhabditis belari]|uniref:Uncharacterized protein n=1 Tax=Mesorhabditis belari TaxID=2138241 RepID=A0AAF3FIV4_9BILA
MIENEAISLATQTLLITEDVACQVEENVNNQVDVGNQTEKVIHIDRSSQVFEQAPVTVAVENKTISLAIQTFLSTKDVTNQTEDVIIIDRPSQTIDQSTFTVEIVAIDEATQTILVTDDVSVQTEKVVLFDSLQSLKQGPSKNTQTLLITEDAACQSETFIQQQTDVANQTNEVVLVDGATQNTIETVNRATSTTPKQKMVERNTQTDHPQGIIDSEVAENGFVKRENEVSDHEQRISVMTMNEIDGLSHPSHKLQPLNSIRHQRMDTFDQTRQNLALYVPTQGNGHSRQIDYETIQGASVMTVNEIEDYAVPGKQTEVLNGPESCTSTVNHNPQRSEIDQSRRTELQELQVLLKEFITKASKIDGSFEGAQRVQFLNGPRGCTSVSSTFDNIPQRSEITGDEAPVGEVDGLAEPNALINPRDHIPVQSRSNNHPDIIEETETKMRIDEKFFACNYYSKSQRMITFSQKTTFGFEFKLKPVSFRKRERLILQYFFNGFDSTNRDFVFPKLCLFLVLPFLIWSAAAFPLLASLFFTPDGVFYLIDVDGHYETKISTPSDLVNRLITYQSFTMILLILMLFAARPSLNAFYQKPIVGYLLTNTGRERFNSRKASHFINDLFYLRLVFFFSFLYIFTNFVSIACFCLQYFQLPDNSNVNGSFYSYFFALTFPGAIFAFTTLMVAILVVKSAQFYLKLDRALKLKT